LIQHVEDIVERVRDRCFICREHVDENVHHVFPGARHSQPRFDPIHV